MTIVRLKLEKAAGVPEPYVPWRVDLIGDGGKPSGGLDLGSDAVVIRLIESGKLGADGTALVELTPTADLLPAGMVYRAEFRAPGSARQETLVFAGFTGAGPVDATDWIVELPGSLPSAALDLHVAAADPHAGYVLESTLGAANGVATLGADAKIPGAQLPSLAIGETFTVASQAAMLGLTAQRGDVAVRTDLDPDGFFLLAADDATVLANWVQITAPGAVTSVDGQVGAVALSGTYVPLTQRGTANGIATLGADGRLDQPGSSVLELEDFGSLATTASTTAALQAAMTEWNGVGGTLRFPKYRTLTVDTGIVLPTAANDDLNRYYLDGNGSKLKCASGFVGVLLGDAIPATIGAALGGRQFDISRLRLEGDNATAGQTLLRFIGGQNNRVSRCSVAYATIGIDWQHADTGLIELVDGKHLSEYTIVVRSSLGIVTGADAPNSAPNHVTIFKVRDYAKAAQTAEIAVLGASGCVVRDCVTEGNNPVNAILHDPQGSTVVNTFTVENHHAENVPTDAHIRLKSMVSGVARIKDIWGGNGSPFIHADAGGSAATIHAEIPRLNTLAPNFKVTNGSLTRWVFGPLGSFGRERADDPTLWAGAVVPQTHALRFANPTSEATVASGGAGLASTAPFLTGTDVHLFSTRTTTGFTGIHLNGPTEVKVGTAPTSANMQSGFLGFGVNATDGTIVFAHKNGAGTYFTTKIPFAGPGFFAGNGTPEGQITAAAGAFYQRLNGAAGTTVYVKESGTGNTGWAAIASTSGLRVVESANGKQGVATLVAGTVTVANTSVTANSRILLTAQSLGTVTDPKPVAVTARVAGTSFTIRSADATDTSVIAWEMFEPA